MFKTSLISNFSGKVSCLVLSLVLSKKTMQWEGLNLDMRFPGGKLLDHCTSSTTGQY